MVGLDSGGATASFAARSIPRRIAGLAISNQRETFAAFDAAGEPLRPGMVWLDDRAQPQVRAFGETFGGERAHAINGKPLDVIPCLFRILWMREHEPEIFARTHKFADVHAFLSFRLTGRWVASTASADPTGLLDIRTFDWSDEILDAAGVARAQLPSLARPGEWIGEVTGAAAAETGLPAGSAGVCGRRRWAMRGDGRRGAAAGARLRQSRHGGGRRALWRGAGDQPRLPHRNGGGRRRLYL